MTEDSSQLSCCFYWNTEVIRLFMFLQVPGRTRLSFALLQGLLKAGTNLSLKELLLSWERTRVILVLPGHGTVAT